jgi:hypothetical protein
MRVLSALPPANGIARMKTPRCKPDNARITAQPTAIAAVEIIRSEMEKPRTRAKMSITSLNRRVRRLGNSCSLAPPAAARGY